MPPRRTRLDPQARRSSILQAGLRVFGRRPYDEASVEEVALEAGVSAGLLYHYFPSKHNLFTAAYEHLSDQLLSAIPTQPGPTTWHLIDKLLDVYLQFAQRRPGVILFLLRPPTGQHSGETSLNEQLNNRIAAVIATGCGIPPDDALRRTAIRAWLAFVDQAVREMLEGNQLSKAQVKTMSLQVLQAAIQHPSLTKASSR
jgi:AcrR family transcriptional regulator